jgi:hypothetical protein
LSESDMTKKKRLLLLASLPLAIAVTLGVLALLPPRLGVTKANFDRIEIGMTKAEVEAIFGERSTFEAFVKPSSDRYSWQSDGGAQAWVYTTAGDNAVRNKVWLESAETIPNKIRRWLHFD